MRAAGIRCGIGMTAIRPCEVTVSVKRAKTLGAELERRMRPGARPGPADRPALGCSRACIEEKNESGVRPRSHGFFDQPHTLDQAASLLAASLRLQQRPGLLDGRVVRAGDHAPPCRDSESDSPYRRRSAADSRQRPKKDESDALRTAPRSDAVTRRRSWRPRPPGRRPCGSRTARSARTLRSSSMLATFSVCCRRL